MTPIILVVLAAVWAAVLLPPWLRNRGGGATSVSSFQRRLSSLERRNGPGGYMPRSPGMAVETDPSHLPLGSRHPVSVDGSPRLVPGADEAAPLAAVSSVPAQPARPARKPVSPKQAAARRASRRRRRQLLYGLLGASGVTFLAGMAVGGVAWALFLLSFAALAAYVALLVMVQKRAAEQEIKVAFLPHTNIGAEPTALLGRDVLAR